jgi:hypothetical protein
MSEISSGYHGIGGGLVGSGAHRSWFPVSLATELDNGALSASIFSELVSSRIAMPRTKRSCRALGTRISAPICRSANA